MFYTNCMIYNMYNIYIYNIYNYMIFYKDCMILGQTFHNQYDFIQRKGTAKFQDFFASNKIFFLT